MNTSKTTIGKLVLPVIVAAAVLLLAPTQAAAWEGPCDFLTGGGYIIHRGAKANFGVGGGCKHGSGINGVPYWGHLEYQDHGTTPKLNVHWMTITGYAEEGDTVPDPKTKQPRGTRYICGTARTNLFGDVTFLVRASDGRQPDGSFLSGEPGVNDQFDIALWRSGVIVYNTLGECPNGHYLGSACTPGSSGGGNIQLHKPNPSTTGVFGSCPP